MKSVNQFPFTCTFYKTEKDPNDFYGGVTKRVVYSGSCDIQLTSEGVGNIAEKANYTVLMPLYRSSSGSYVMGVDKGDKFEGLLYGKKVIGSVIDSMPSQLGKASVFVESIGT